jgi:hypothetical protein
MDSIIKVRGTEIKIEGRLIRLAHVRGDKHKFLDNPLPVIDGITHLRPRIDVFTFMQRLPDTSPKYGYPMEWDNLAVIPITTFDHWWTDQIGFKARNKAKQASKKGVSIREVPFDDALVQGISEVYNESPVRQGKPSRHYGKDFETVRKEASTFLDSSIFIGAYLEDKLIGFVKLVIDDSRTQASLMNIVSMIGHRDKAPTNALVAEAVRVCADRGIPYLVYASFTYGKKEQDSFSDFKERNGFQRIDLPRYYVPLTPIGKAALRFGLHHRLVDLLPESVASRLRIMRNNWYNRKLRVAQDSRMTVLAPLVALMVLL